MAMKIDVITIFPRMVEAGLAEGVVGRARTAGLLDIVVHNLRDFTTDKHHVVDDVPFGGGPGMVMKPEPFFAALDAIRARARHAGGGDSDVAGGRAVHAGRARGGWSALGHFVLLCGRYEGIDERVREALATEELSIGDYVLSGGESARAGGDRRGGAARARRGRRRQSVDADSFTRGLLDYPHYTRPAEFEGRQVPEVLLSGHHAEIRRWRRETALQRTQQRRPDLLATAALDARRTRVVEKEQVMTAMELVEKAQLTERPRIKAGDTVRVHVRVKEGDKERIQIFEGVVIGLRRGGNRATFTVRKVSFSQGVERIFPLHSPTISKVEVVRSAKVRRAKLYFLRDLKGKAARMKEVKKTPSGRQVRTVRTVPQVPKVSARSAILKIPSTATASWRWPAWMKSAGDAWRAR